MNSSKTTVARLSVSAFVLLQRWLGIGVVLCLSACATLSPTFEQPQVSISQLQLLPGSAVQPRFEVGLLISNPNGFDLKLKGMSYSLSVNDYKLVAGVTADIPVVPAYGTAELALPATANVVNGIRLFQNLLAQSTEDISYRLEAALDTGNLLLPKIRIIEEGRVPVGLPVQGSPVTQPVRF